MTAGDVLYNVSAWLLYPATIAVSYRLGRRKERRALTRDPYPHRVVDIEPEP